MASGMTSYERVYHLLFKTSTCKDVWNAALKDLDEVKIKRVEWTLSRMESIARVDPIFDFTSNFSWHGRSIQNSDIHAGIFITSDLVDKILALHYGSEKDVKTFNCNNEVVRHGGVIHRKDEYGNRVKEHQDSFREFLVQKFSQEANEKITATTMRLQAEVQMMMATDEFRKSQHEALVNFCKSDITKALLPWHNMEEQVLQDAWDQFICTAIMRT